MLYYNNNCNYHQISYLINYHSYDKVEDCIFYSPIKFSRLTDFNIIELI
jgi:hypothetical protein